MFTSRLLILSVAVWATAILATANADSITIMLTGITDNEAEMEWGGSHDPGVVRRGSSDLELGYERTAGYGDEHTAQRVGLRYTNINIPAGSTINSVHIQFMADDQPDKTIFNPLNDPEIGTLEPLVASVSFYGYLDPVTPANSPALPAQSQFVGAQPILSTLYTLTDITGGQCAGTCGTGGGPMGGVGSDITNVTAPVHWDDIPTWSTGDVNGNGVADLEDWLAIPGAAGPDQLSPDLSSIVQEIIDLPGWVANNAISFLIDPKAVEDHADFDYDDDVDGIDFLLLQRGDIPVPVNEHSTISSAHWQDLWEQNFGNIGPQSGEDVFFQGNRTAVALTCGWDDPEIGITRCESFPAVAQEGAPILTIDFTPPALAAAVPEPATGITLLIGMVSLLFRRNRDDGLVDSAWLLDRVSFDMPGRWLG
jgi:hypothetical protein